MPPSPAPQPPDKCLRCGQCCHWVGAGEVKACRFLVKVGKQMACMMYSMRKSVKVNDWGYCKDRKDLPNDYPGCPYNTGKPMV